MARRADAELIEALEAARIHPLWDRYKKITPVLPDAPDGASVWRWRTSSRSRTAPPGKSRSRISSAAR